jgi:hypothetical protein
MLEQDPETQNIPLLVNTIFDPVELTYLPSGLHIPYQAKIMHKLHDVNGSRLKSIVKSAIKLENDLDD